MAQAAQERAQQGDIAPLSAARPVSVITPESYVAPSEAAIALLTLVRAVHERQSPAGTVAAAA